MLRLIFPVDLFGPTILPRSGCPPQADSFVGVSATNEKKYNLCALCVSAVRKYLSIPEPERRIHQTRVGPCNGS